MQHNETPIIIIDGSQVDDLQRRPPLFCELEILTTNESRQRILYLLRTSPVWSCIVGQRDSQR